MTEDDRTQLYAILKKLFDEEDESTPIPERQKDILSLFNKIVELSSILEDTGSANANDDNDLILDLEHIIAVGTDRVDMENLPEELRELTKKEYLEKLDEVIQRRRYRKDISAIARTVRQRCTNVVNFIVGMDKRRYEVRYKNPGVSYGSAVEPREMAPVDREEEEPGILQTRVAITSSSSPTPISRPRPKPQPPKPTGIGYASKNYPH